MMKCIKVSKEISKEIYKFIPIVVIPIIKKLKKQLV